MVVAEDLVQHLVLFRQSMVVIMSLDVVNCIHALLIKLLTRMDSNL